MIGDGFENWWQLGVEKDCFGRSTNLVGMKWQPCSPFVKPLQNFATLPLLEEIEDKEGRNSKVLMNRKEFGGECQKLGQKLLKKLGIGRVDSDSPTSALAHKPLAATTLGHSKLTFARSSTSIHQFSSSYCQLQVRVLNMDIDPMWFKILVKPFRS